MAVKGHKNKESVKRYLHHRRDDQMYNLSRVLETARSGTNSFSLTTTTQTIAWKSSIRVEKRTYNVDNWATSGSGSGERIVVEKDDTKVVIFL